MQVLYECQDAVLKLGLLSHCALRAWSIGHLVSLREGCYSLFQLLQVYLYEMLILLTREQDAHLELLLMSCGLL